MATSGVHVAIEVEGDGQNMRIVAVNDGGQLAKQIRPLDRLVSVNDVSLAGKKIDEVMELLSGAEGTEVKITVARPSDVPAGQISVTVLRTVNEESDRRIATLSQIKDLIITDVSSEGAKEGYWRPTSTADGRLFAEICDGIKDLKSKAGADNGFLGLGRLLAWMTDSSSQMFGSSGSKQSAALTTEVVPTPQSQALNYSQVLVLRLGTGDFFGEIALVSEKPRQATVKASGNVSVLVMSRSAFTRLCGPLMDILRRNLESYNHMELPSPEEEVAGSEVEKPKAVAQSVSFEEADLKDEVVERKPRTGRTRRKSVYVESVKLEADWEPPHFEKAADEKERLSGFIAKTALLAALDGKARDTVINAVQMVSINKDQDVIVQGDSGDYFYILDSGNCDVLIKQADGSEKKVLEYAPGGSFGELALLHGEPRLATVRASVASVVWKLDRDTFRKIMMSTGKQNMDERTKFLNKVHILNDLSTFEKFKVAESMAVRQFKDEEVIVSEGEEGNEFFIIESGSCHCFKRHHNI